VVSDLNSKSGPAPARGGPRALTLVEMTDTQDRRIETFSKGMRQRTRVAAALVHEPQVLLLDEPFNGMDPRQRMHMMELLHSLGDRGHTILFSSHILEEVEQLSGTVQVIVAGRLAASGDYRRIRRLMTNRPHVFAVQSSDDRRLAVALIGEKSVSGVEIEGTGLTVRASDYGSFTRALPRIALGQGIRLRKLLPSDESLESVFSYLLEA
jgi:ABC-2 type transport system ATP-binding protein